MNCKIEYEEKGKNVKRGNLIGMEWNGWMNCKFRYGMVWYGMVWREEKGKGTLINDVEKVWA